MLLTFQHRILSRLAGSRPLELAYGYCHIVHTIRSHHPRAIFQPLPNALNITHALKHPLHRSVCVLPITESGRSVGASIDRFGKRSRSLTRPVQSTIRRLLAAHSSSLPPLSRRLLATTSSTALPAAAAATSARGDFDRIRLRLAGLAPFSSSSSSSSGAGRSGSGSGRRSGSQVVPPRVPPAAAAAARPQQARQQLEREQQRSQGRMTSTDHGGAGGVGGVGGKRDAGAAALDGSGPAVAADAEAEAARAAQQEARDAKQSKRMKRLMQTDPAAAERMEYRRRVGICCRDQDMAEALRYDTSTTLLKT